MTGSINRPDTARLTVAPEATPSVAPVAMAKRPEPNVPVLPEPTTKLVEEDARPAATEPPPVVAALIAPEPETASTPPANAAPPPPLASTVDNPACRELNTFSQTINIQFDYTKANLDRSVFRALDAFADRLRECPTFKVTIEGHTDSDGQADRNEALSLRRAKAVLEYLVDVGANANQLTAIGLGQSRPLAPNVTPENKRSNRRAVLVVEVPGQNN